jgi:hypothetical protein
MRVLSPSIEPLERSLLGVNGENGEFASAFQYVGAEDVNRRTLAGAWNSGDAYAVRVARVGQTFLNHFLSNGLMFGREALDKRHGLSQNGGVTLAYALYVVVDRQLGAWLAVLEIGIDHWWLFDT